MPSSFLPILLVLAACDYEPAEPAEALPRSGGGPLDNGAPVSLPNIDECSGSLLTDAIDVLCDLWPGMECTDTSGNVQICTNYTRQIFTGVTTPDNSPVPLTGRGRAGHANADAMLCVLRQLSPELDGPVTSTASVNVAIGNVIAREEVGFTGFDHEAHAFTGYRRVEFDMPVVGKVTTATQSIRLSESSDTATDTSPSGAVGSITGYGLNLEAEELEKHLVLKPPGFDVPTPIGVFEVRPEFEMHTHPRVIDSDFDGNTSFDIANWSQPGVTVRFGDLYGLLPGIQYATQDVTLANLLQHQNKGWYSGMGLGTRSTLPGAAPWVPGSAPVERPNYDLTVPREAEEARPTTSIRAAATLHYPDNPWDLLPPWVVGLPFLTNVEAWVDVTAALEAGTSGQLAIAAHEGARFTRGPGGTLQPFNVTTFEIDERSQVEASFELEVVLHLKVSLDPPWPLDAFDIIDVHKTIPIPIAGDKVASAQTTALGYSVNAASQLDAMVELDGTTHVGQAATESFIEACFAEPTEDEDIPEWEPVPGDPSELFELGLQPCNVCVAVDEQNLGTPEEPGTIPENLATLLLPSDEAPRWECAGQHKTGCMDLCWYDPSTGSLVVVKSALDLANAAAAAGDAATAAFYAACMN